MTYTPEGNQPGATRQTVLVVDDEELVRTFMKRALVGAGYLVLGAGSGQEALAILEFTAVDLVVTDIRMPGMDGRDLGVQIAKLSPAPPILYASASDQPPTGKDTYYIPKPFKGAELVRMAQEILAQRRGE